MQHSTRFERRSRRRHARRARMRLLPILAGVALWGSVAEVHAQASCADWCGAMNANCAKGDWDPANWTPSGGGVCAAVTSNLPIGRWVPRLVIALGLIVTLVVLGRRRASGNAARA
ncbi:MAG: hypothetical protein HRU00_13700 [Myxococcales bacterium]|nr:hypothetical protein [Myxococcales bacterium]